MMTGLLPQRIKTQSIQRQLSTRFFENITSRVNEPYIGGLVTYKRYITIKILNLGKHQIFVFVLKSFTIQLCVQTTQMKCQYIVSKE